MLKSIINRILSKVQQFKCLINQFVEQRLFCQHRAMIIMFHHVSDEVLEDVMPSCKCKVRDFEKILEFINERAISLDDLLVKIHKGNYKGHHYVVTFDDVPEDFYYNAFPRLSVARIPFTLYVTYDYIGSKGYLSYEQLREISNSPLATIGAHTMTHPMLRDSDIDLQYEVSESRDRLATMLNREIRHFAYPYGSLLTVNKKVVDFIKCADFDSAVMTLSGYVNPFTCRNLYCLPRVHNELFMNRYMRGLASLR